MNKPMTKENFLLAVRHEIDALKKHADPREIHGLRFSTFDPDSPQDCIYGQMTESCTSDRAKELMYLCVLAISDFSLDSEGSWKSRTSKTILESGMNGSFDAQGWKKDSRVSLTGNRRNYSYMTALEVYILLKTDSHEQVINYLKGNLDTLTLEL